MCVCVSVCTTQAKKHSDKQQKKNEFVRAELAKEDLVTGFSPMFDPG